jgi:hypothetical protein
MFDLKSFQPLGRIPAAEDADAILFDSVSGRVFTLNSDAHSSTVIDAKAGKLIINIALGGKPEYGVSAGDGKVYACVRKSALRPVVGSFSAAHRPQGSRAPGREVLVPVFRHGPSKIVVPVKTAAVYGSELRPSPRSRTK